MQKKKIRIGIVDTMFARVDMAKIAIATLDEKFPEKFEVFRQTVPGIKDLAVSCLQLFEEKNCDICLAFGMVGKAELDLHCSNQGSIGIQIAKMMSKRHIIEVFVHESEAKDEAELLAIAKDRSSKHAINAYQLISNPNEITKFAGMGKRQGKNDAGPIII